MHSKKITAISERARRNTGAEEQEMRAVVVEAFRPRLGADMRAIHELALGDRRIDLVLVGARDIVGVEIKSSLDRLDRLGDQIAEYRRFIPEVWGAYARKFAPTATGAIDRGNRLIVHAGAIVETPPKARRPFRDECINAMMLHLLWQSELARIAQRTDVIPGTTLSSDKPHKIRAMLARLLTGNQIVAETCRELRARPLVGIGSDGAKR